MKFEFQIDGTIDFDLKNKSNLSDLLQITLINNLNKFNLKINSIGIQEINSEAKSITKLIDDIIFITAKNYYLYNENLPNYNLLAKRVKLNYRNSDIANIRKLVLWSFETSKIDSEKNILKILANKLGKIEIKELSNLRQSCDNSLIYKYNELISINTNLINKFIAI
jgi:hypothetical protein